MVGPAKPCYRTVDCPVLDVLIPDCSWTMPALKLRPPAERKLDHVTCVRDESGTGDHRGGLSETTTLERMPPESRNSCYFTPDGNTVTPPRATSSPLTKHQTLIACQQMP